jgi:hypothetical protein
MNKKHLKTLSDLEHARSCLRSPSMPKDYVPRHKYVDNTANGLTRCVVDWINFNGGQAERISTTGRVIDSSVVVSDIFGNTRKIGSTKYIKGTGTKGSADISAVIKGRAVKIEVKMKDKQSIHQVKYQQAIENAGGQYWLVHDFDEFMFHYESFIDYLK